MNQRDMSTPLLRSCVVTGSVFAKICASSVTVTRLSRRAGLRPQDETGGQSSTCCDSSKTPLAVLYEAPSERCSLQTQAEPLLSMRLHECSVPHAG